MPTAHAMLPSDLGPVIHWIRDAVSWLGDVSGTVVRHRGRGIRLDHVPQRDSRKACATRRSGCQDGSRRLALRRQLLSWITEARSQDLGGYGIVEQFVRSKEGAHLNNAEDRVEALGEQGPAASPSISKAAADVVVMFYEAVDAMREAARQVREPDAIMALQVATGILDRCVSPSVGQTVGPRLETACAGANSSTPLERRSAQAVPSYVEVFRGRASLERIKSPLLYQLSYRVGRHETSLRAYTSTSQPKAQVGPRSRGVSDRYPCVPERSLRGMPYSTRQIGSRSRPPDRVLVERIAEGDELAFWELFARYRSTVYATAYAVLVDPEAVDTVVADTFREARRMAPTFLPTHASVSGWLTHLTRLSLAGRSGASPETNRPLHLHSA